MGINPLIGQEGETQTGGNPSCPVSLCAPALLFLNRPQDRKGGALGLVPVTETAAAVPPPLL